MSSRTIKALLIGVVIYLVMAIFGGGMAIYTYNHAIAAIATKTITRSDVLWVLIWGGMTGCFVYGLVLTLLRLLFPDKGE